MFLVYIFLNCLIFLSRDIIIYILIWLKFPMWIQIFDLNEIYLIAIWPNHNNLYPQNRKNKKIRCNKFDHRIQFLLPNEDTEKEISKEIFSSNSPMKKVSTSYASDWRTEKLDGCQKERKAINCSSFCFHQSNHKPQLI